jgi:hypothetical protein
VVSSSPPSKTGGGVNGDQDSPGLYERLGGVYSIATVVDDFIDWIMIPA